MTRRRRTVPVDRIANRKIVENAVQTADKLGKDDLTKLANTFLKGTAGMKKKHVRKYLERLDHPEAW